MARVLYLSYDGLLEPLGESQVLAYLERLAASHAITLVSFEKAADWADAARIASMRQRTAQAGIEWVALRYHNRPPVLATAYDLAHGLVRCLALVRRRRIEIVHARSYVPAALALALKRMVGTGLIFDMRGFWIDERVTAGLWRHGSLLYRVTKRVERRLLMEADAVVSLTHAAVAAMRRFPYVQHRPPRFTVIPTCADLERFRPPLKNGAPRAPAGSRPFTLGYVGSVGTRYLFDLVLECFAILQAQRPGAQLLILNQGGHPHIHERLLAHDIAQQWVQVKAVPYADVATELRRIDAGIFFYKPAFSIVATAPTKLGEFLGCGIPCLANAGIGDLEELLEGRRVGVILRDATAQGKVRAVKELLDLVDHPETKRRCVETARLFSLEHGVQGYDMLYQSIRNGQAAVR